MKLEDQVVSLELAKKLKVLNVKQDSYFVWQDINQVGAHLTESWAAVGFEHSNAEHTSAFTVAELGEMLPIMVRGKVVKFHKLGVVDQWIVEYTPVTHDNEKYHTEGATEADARAKMLIYLIEKNLVKP